MGDEGSGAPQGATSARTVLVVDDEPDVRLLMRVILEGDGYAVAEATDGDEALQAIEQDPPDLVFLDIRMPRVDGWTVVAKLREKGILGRTAVVLLSAHTSPGTAEMARVTGCKGYVTKPFRREQIATAARQALSA